MTKARHKKTGRIHDIFCFDDYFGRRNYGYDDGTKVMREDEFRQHYEEEA